MHPWYVISDLDGIRNEFPDAEIYYAEGVSNQFKRRLFRTSVFRTRDGKKGLEAKYYTCSSDTGTLSSRLLKQQAKAAIYAKVTNAKLENDISAFESKVNGRFAI